MASVLIEAQHLLATIDRAEAALRPKLNEQPSGWGRKAIFLQAMKDAADWAIMHPIGSKLVSLDNEERQLIEPYLT